PRLMSFRLFGVNVEIQIFFWVMAAILGYLYLPPTIRDPRLMAAYMAIFMLVVLVSILVHEFGHALAFMRHGIRPEITLHGMGGVTSPHVVLPLGRLDNVVIAAAGPMAGFLLAAIFYAILKLAPSAVHSLPMPARYAVAAT